MTSSTTDKMKGKKDQAVGKVKEETGKAVGNNELKNKGKVQQVKGHAEEAKGKIKDALKD